MAKIIKETIAESRPEEKEMMISIIMNCMQ